MSERHPIEIGGIKYISVSEAARDIGISRERLRYQIKKRERSECSHIQTTKAVQDGGICYRGIWYPTIKEFANRFNLSYPAVLMQLQRGKSAEEIINKHNKKVVNEVIKHGRRTRK